MELLLHTSLFVCNLAKKKKERKKVVKFPFSFYCPRRATIFQKQHIDQLWKSWHLVAKFIRFSL